MAEFRFTNEHSPSQIGNVIDVMRRPRLWIPTENDYPDTTSATVDTKLANTGMVDFLMGQGYEIESVADLYRTGTGLDAVFTKQLIKQ